MTAHRRSWAIFVLTPKLFFIFSVKLPVPAPGDAMGHTDQPDSGRAQGQYSGHVLSALAMMVASHGRPGTQEAIGQKSLQALAEVQGVLWRWLPVGLAEERMARTRRSGRHLPLRRSLLLPTQADGRARDQYRLAGSTQALGHPDQVRRLVRGQVQAPIAGGDPLCPAPVRKRRHDGAVPEPLRAHWK